MRSGSRCGDRGAGPSAPVLALLRDDEGGFTTVDEATSFYLNEDGSVTLVFPEYTIAAGAAGIVEIPVAG